MSDPLRAHGLYPARLLYPWDFPGKNTRVDCHLFLQGIFPTRDRTHVLCIGRWILYCWASREGPVCYYSLPNKALNHDLYHRNSIFSYLKLENWFNEITLDFSVLPTVIGTFLVINWFLLKETWIWFSSVAQSCPPLCDPIDCSTPGFPVHHQFPALDQTHVYWVGVAVQTPHPLMSPSPPTFNLS